MTTTTEVHGDRHVSARGYIACRDSCRLADLPCGCQDVHYDCGHISREHDFVVCDGEPVQAPDGQPGPDAAGESYVLPGFEIIHAYTREDAIADGALVDVTSAARRFGFRMPVALTRAVWEDCVAWADGDNARKGTLQDEDGRLADVLHMAVLAASRTKAGSDRATVRLVRTPRDGRVRKPRPVELVAVCGPGDQAEPVITIMQPNED